VHRLGAPASADAVRGLPGELAAFLRSFDGAELFIDALTLFPAADVRREGDLLVFGQNANDDRLALDDEGRVLLLEEDTGEILAEGTGFARWLEGWIAAEGTLYDREGEFREGAYDEEDLSAAAAEKRERKALKADPEAVAPAWRLARALVRQKQPAKARRVLAELTGRAPGFAWGWFDLGKLAREEGDLEEAEAAFGRAASADPEYEHAGYFWAHAARAAAARGDEKARAAHASRALEADPEIGRAQREAARTLAGEERSAEAREAAEVAAAVAPRDLEVLALLRQLSAPASRSPRPARPERPRRRTPR
jgi:tetratricopeptide (TPR) repeat protein